MAETYVTLTEGRLTKIKTRQHEYYADEPTQDGGTDTAVTPMEMAIGALGACIAVTVKMYAERKGWPLESIELVLDEERFNGMDYPDYDGDAKFVHEIRKAIKFNGPLDAQQRERLLEIAGKCPVHRLIALPSFFKEVLLAADDDLTLDALTEKQAE